MGHVYLGRDSELGRLAALKVMRTDRVKGVRPSDRQRFLREALTTARLQHPGIPPVFQVKKNAEGQLYYAMKLIEGISLDDILKRIAKDDVTTIENYPIARMIGILVQVCRTLDYAHTRGFIHRDLKPSNIFIGDFGEVYLIDWGLTKKIRFDEPEEESSVMEEIEIDHAVREEIDVLDLDAPEDDEHLTLKGDLLGTPAYMPPEQTYREAQLDETADIFSLGVILYRLLTLRLPIESRNFKTLIISKREGEFLTPEAVAPDRDIPPELSAIAMQAMAMNPSERFENVQELRRSLEFWLNGGTQYRRISHDVFRKERFTLIPGGEWHRWELSEGVIRINGNNDKGQSTLYFKRSYPGDLRLSMNMRVLPKEDKESSARFGLLFRSNEPVERELISQYKLTFAGNKSTRLTLTRNGTVIASNENILFETNKKYHMVVETDNGEIRVSINARLVLSCIDRNPLSGPYLAIVDQGQPALFTRLDIMTRGLPLKTETIEIPEALMAEGCYSGAKRRFLELSRNHRNRYVGQWAAYRAGIAAYRQSFRKEDALDIWGVFRGTRYEELQFLGLARIDLLDGNPEAAAAQLNRILKGHPPNILLRSVADFAQEHTQELLGHKEMQWATIEKWIRITLELDERLERRDPITVSLLWRWLFHIIREEPDALMKALGFVKRIYGEGKGTFGELITHEEMLKNLILRVKEMSHNSFLIEKLMRLIVWHEDPIESLDTLGRFYLNSGHDKIALQSFQQLIKVCLAADRAVPPAPLAYVSTYLWLHEEETEARRYFKLMGRYSQGWGPSDAVFLLGLDDYRMGRRLNAVSRWATIYNEQNDHKAFRKVIAGALIGTLPSDPDEADIPDRSDYRLLFCLFVGLRHFLDWKQGSDGESETIAKSLLLEALALMKPSYDIYASTTSFVRLPLTAMGLVLSDLPEPDVLDFEEKSWLRMIIMNVRHEMTPRAKS